MGFFCVIVSASDVMIQKTLIVKFDWSELTILQPLIDSVATIDLLLIACFSKIAFPLVSPYSRLYLFDFV